MRWSDPESGSRSSYSLITGGAGEGPLAGLPGSRAIAASNTEFVAFGAC